MNKRVSIIVALLVVIAGVYWLSTMKPTGVTSVEIQPENEVKIVKNGPIGIASGPAGNYLVDRNDLTLYVNLDDQNQSGEIVPSCNAQCEETWLPYLLGAEEVGLNSSDDPVLSKLNLFERADGQRQYALGVQPLYTNVNDDKLGEINGATDTNWGIARP